MTGRTHFLELLVLTASAFPTQVAALPALSGRHAGPHLWVVPAAVWLTAAPALALTAQPVPFAGADPLLWAAIGLAGGACALALELLIGGVWAWTAFGVRPSGVELAAGVPAAGTPLAASTVTTGLGEEVLFRGVWPAILLTGFGWPAPAVIALVTVVYAANHAYFGRDIVVQKLGSGLIFTMLAYAGGGVLAAGIAHAGENLLIAYLPRLLQRVRPATA